MMLNLQISDLPTVRELFEKGVIKRLELKKENEDLQGGIEIGTEDKVGGSDNKDEGEEDEDEELQKPRIQVKEEILDKISLHRGDITKLDIDVIVNAANKSLLGGGGVDGAIHLNAGPQLLDECRNLNGCDTGDAKITRGYNLPADYIIHTVGPVYYSENRDIRAKQLSSCYKRSLQLAIEYKLKTIAFPCISTGVYRYPGRDAATIALTEVTNFLESEQGSEIERVIFCVFLAQDEEIYKKLLPQFYSFVIPQEDKAGIEAEVGVVVSQS